MNIVLIFFAIPVAIIILSIVLERILKCPVLTAATFFSVFLIVAFAVFDTSFLVFVIAYTIISYITALISEFIFSRFIKCKCNCKCNCKIREQQNEGQFTNEEIERIAARVAEILCNTNCYNDISTINIRNQNGQNTTWCCKRK